MGAPVQSSVYARLKQRPWKSALLAGIGGAFAIALLALARDITQLHLLIPPFGASCVLAFGFPASPFAHPKNIIGGHAVSAVAGLMACYLLGFGVMGVSVGVGLAIAAMMVTDTVHPPAGANPIVVALSQPNWLFIVLPVIAGAIAIVLMARLYAAAIEGVRTAAPAPSHVIAADQAPRR